jgi:biopolymer transport protein ExbD
MKIPSQHRKYGLALNITPLIDLVFLLNIFFLVATYFIRNEQVAAVDLPSATKGQDDDAESDAPGRLTVTVMPDGQLSSSGKTISPDDFVLFLSETLSEHGPDGTEVRIRADKAVPYSFVEPLLVKAAELGVTKIRFAVLRESD